MDFVEKPVLHPKYIQNAFWFLNLRTTKEFFELLQVNPFVLEYHINQPIYFAIRLAKKKGGERLIQAPNEELKLIQKKLNYYFQAVYLSSKPRFVHGFVPYNKDHGQKCTIQSNAQTHIGKNYLLNMDLENFFPNISAKRIRDLLTLDRFQFEDDLATLIALLCTYKKQLPIGAPSSPVLANLACYKMDLELFDFCYKNSISYSRYADDLSFSSNTIIDAMQIESLQTIIHQHQFKINHKKTRQQFKSSKQVVTGLVVNKKVNVDRTYLKRLRAVLHSCKTEGIHLAFFKHKKHLKGKIISMEQFLSHLEGQINFVGQVRGLADVIYLRLKFGFICLESD